MTETQDVSTPISMLWESTDAITALTERFGFASTAEATGWLTDVLAEHWGLGMDTCERLHWRPTPADMRAAFVAAYESVLPSDGVPFGDQIVDVLAESLGHGTNLGT